MLLASAAAMIAQLAPPPSLAAPIGPDTVIATVDGMNITVSDYQKMSAAAPPQLKQALAQFIKQGGSAEVLKQMFVFQFLADEGDKDKIDEKSPFKEEIESQRRWLIASYEVNYRRDTYPVTDQMIDDFYSKNQTRWEQAKIKVIFIAFQPGSQSVKPDDLAAITKQFVQSQGKPARPEAEAMSIATEVVKQLREGADFAKMVEKYSEDATSKPTGGDFGAITMASSYPDDFKKAVLALQVGQVSDPIRQANGFYIVKREEKNLQPLKDLREQISQDIRSQHLKDELEALDKRFAPKILKPEFFANPDAFLPKSNPAPATRP